MSRATTAGMIRLGDEGPGDTGSTYWIGPDGRLYQETWGAVKAVDPTRVQQDLAYAVRVWDDEILRLTEEYERQVRDRDDDTRRRGGEAAYAPPPTPHQLCPDYFTRRDAALRCLRALKHHLEEVR